MTGLRMAEMIALQDAANRRFLEATPAERAADAREQLLYIGSVEPEMAWVLDALSD